MAIRFAALAVAAAAAPLLVAVAFAQQEPAPPPGTEQPPVTTQAQPPSRGLFESIGRWIDQGTAGFRSHVDGARSSFGDLNDRAAGTTKTIGDTAAEVGKSAVDAGVAAADVTRDAVGTVARLPMTRVVRGRERCAIAANGAPDCQAAAEAMCRKQGYASGKSMDFTSAEHCSPRAMLSGRQSEDDCTTVTFISRAVCQ
jgi:hypothetical protein